MRIITGLQWYKKVYSFLEKNVCYLTTPYFDEELRKSVLDDIKTTTRIRLKTEFKDFGLYVCRGKSGHSMVVVKDVFDDFCTNHNISVDNLLCNGSIVPFTAKMFMETRHKKNVGKEIRRQKRREKKDSYRDSVLNSANTTKEQKERVLLDIWSEKKLENNEVASTKYEDILFSKLRGIYRNRVKRQQKFIIRNRVYFADIYMKAYKVAIEVDGGYHNTKKQMEKDDQKDLDLSTNGLLVIRIKNEDVLKCFHILKGILDGRHEDIVKGIKVPTGTLRLMNKKKINV